MYPELLPKSTCKRAPKNNKDTYVKTNIDTSNHTYIVTNKRQTYTQEANNKIRFGPIYMYAFNVYTHELYKKISIHKHAYNLLVSIKIVNTNIETLCKTKAIVYHEPCISSTPIIIQSHMQTYIHQFIPTKKCV